MKILITNCLLRKVFDLVNILKSNHYKNDIIYANPGKLGIIKKIYNSENVFLLRNDSYYNDIAKISNHFKDEVIVFLPIEEKETMYFYNFIKKYKNHNFKFLLPNESDYRLSINKKQLNLYCHKNDIPCPKIIPKNDMESLNYELPIVLKPISGSGGANITYINSLNDKKIKNIDYDSYFVQELIEKPREVKAGFFLCTEGNIISFYSHQRIRTFPEKGGVSVLSKSGYDIEIKEAGLKIIKKLNWDGLIMIEFLKCTKSNEYKLIEINPRVWGSIILSKFCNADLINDYIKKCLNKPVKQKLLVEEKFIRWIFPYDILYFFKNPTNPFNFFSSNKNTCYINFTYSDYLSSLKFILLTYFNFKKIIKKIG